MKIVKTVAAILIATALTGPALADQPASGEPTPVKEAGATPIATAAPAESGNETKKPIAQPTVSDERQTAEGRGEASKPSQS